VEIVRDITLIAHFVGLAMVLGPFLIQMRAHQGYAFSWILAGGTVQLVTGILLTGLAEMRLADNPDLSLDHTKILVKLVLSLVIFVAALVGFLRQRTMSSSSNERRLLPLVHTAGALAIANIVIAVLWTGVTAT